MILGQLWDSLQVPELLWISLSVFYPVAVTAGLFRFAGFPRLKFILSQTLTFSGLPRLDL